MKIPIPRRLDMQSRPFKGLTVKQTAILAVASSAAMVVAMAGPGSLWMRAAIAIPIVLVALPFIFYRPGGRDFDQYLREQITHFFVRPREREWRRGGLPAEEAPPAPPPAAPAAVIVREPANALVVLIEIFLICSLTWLTGYFAREGGEGMARWLVWIGVK